MAVTLEWVRDHYDANKNRYIDKTEVDAASADYPDKITMEERFAVVDAYYQHTLLPAYPSPPTNGVTLEWVRDNYDANKNRYIDDAEIPLAEDHWNDGIITDEQYDAVASACSAHIRLPAYTTPSPAKGKIVYPNYPTTAMVGASITVECRVKNTGGSSGTFKLALYKGTARVAQTSTWNQGAGTTTGIKRLNTTVPSTGTNVSYVLKCIRVT